MGALHSDVVKVTKEDIKNGIEENAKMCAVALAVERTFTKHYDNIVQNVGENGDIEFLDTETDEYVYHLKVSDNDRNWIYEFIQNFDGGYEVKPFEFGATMREGGAE